MLGVVVAPPAEATGTPSQEAASTVVVGLLKLGNAIGAVSQQPALSTKLPLTDISVRSVLSLDTVVGRHVTSAVTGASPDLDSIDSVVSADPALELTDVASPAGAPAGSRDWTFAVDLTTSVPVPLTYDDQRLTFGAAQLTGVAAGRLQASFRVRYDPTALALRQFSVVGDSTLATHVWTRPTGGSQTTGQALTAATFPAVDGFVQLDAGGTGTIDTTTVLRLRDPNGRGALTTEDFEFSSADEMFTTTTPPGANDVAMTINLSSSLLTSGSHGSVVVGTRTSSTDPYATPVVTRDTALTQLTALTRPQALSAFTQYASAMTGVEGSVDAALPLLTVNLTDLYSPARKLMAVMTEQTVATITCGAADTSPPSGAPRPGQVRYCQATTDGLTVDSGTLVTWSSPDAGVTFAGSTTNTVGPTPTANIRVSGGGGFPRLRVTFTSGGTVYTARSLLVSIQQLAASVGDLGLGGSLSYSGSNRSLEIQVRQTQAASESKSVPTGGNGNLAPLTGLTGLCQADTTVTPRTCPQTGDSPTASTTAPATGSASVTTSGRQIAADFGIGLVPVAPAPVDGAPAPPSPVAYVKPGASGLLWQVATATASMTANAPLVARIGFLRVDVDVTSYSLATTVGSQAARVTTPTGTVTIDGGSVSGAVSVDTLLSATPGTTATRALTATAHLAVQDSPMADTAHTRPINKSGTIDATWANLHPDALPVVVTGGDYDDLRALDIVPARIGTMEAGTSATTHTLVDSTADFLAQFGLSASDTDKSVTRPLYDLDPTFSDWTSCTTFDVVDAHTLTCTAGPMADAADSEHPGAGFAVGHRYVINGDPVALRDVLIQNFAAVMSVYATPEEELGAGRTLPLVDLLPADVDVARTDLGKALAGLQDDSTSDTPATDVSTLQGFALAVSHYAPTADTDLSLDTTNGRLEFETAVNAPTARRDAPLRVTAGDSELRVLSGVDTDGNPVRVRVPLNASSTADVHLAIDLATAATFVGNDTTVTERVTGWATDYEDVQESLAGLDAEYGATTADTGSKNDIEVGIGVAVETTPEDGSATWIPVTDFRGTLAHTRTVQGSAQTCGGAASTADPTLIAACAEIPLTDPGNGNAPLTTVEVALRADESSGGSGDDLANQPLAYQFLTDGLSGLSRTLKDALDGDLAGLSMPLVGTDLDGGANIPDEVVAYVAAARTALEEATVADAAIDENTTATDFAGALTTALNGVDVSGITVPDTSVTISCSGDPCDSTDKVKDVTEVRANLDISGSKTGEKTRFRPGLAGADIDTDIDVPTTTSWTLDVTVGIQRGTGPFLVMEPASGEDTIDVLTATVGATLPTYSASDCHPWNREDEWETKRNANESTSFGANHWVKASQDATAECLDAFVGKLPSVLVDRKDNTAGGNGTSLSATVTVAVEPEDAADAEGRVFLPKLFDKELPFATSADGTGGIAVYFEAFASDYGFFDVMGTIDLDWADGVFHADGVKFGQLVIDAETVYDSVGAGFGKAKKWLAPLNPVVDVLTAPIPGISQLAEMIGEPPISLLQIISRADPRAGIIINLLQFVSLVSNLPGSGDTPELVNLGSGVPGAFKLPTQMIQLNSCSKTVDMTKQGGVAFTAKSSGMGASGRCDEKATSKIKRKVTGEKAPRDPTAGKHIQKQMTKSPQFTLPSITYPVFEDAAQVYNLLLSNGDATLLYVDLGHAGYKVNFTRNFGPLMIGPVPVVASIALIVGFDARFAFGFDTRGLSRMIENVDNGDVGGLQSLSNAQILAEGFFIDDLEKGVDVPEIEITVTVEAGASISIGFAEAGIRGGVVLDLQLDAFDPNGDGKIYSSEFAGASNGPDCAFNVSSGLTFYLQFWFRIDLWLYTIYKAYDIVRSPRIKLFEFLCTVQSPVLASVVGADLWLNMGDRTSSRNAYPTVTNEKFVVRQTAAATGSGTPVEVSAFNLTQRFTVPNGGSLRANAAGGTDTIKLLPGQNITTSAGGLTTVTEIPFTAPALMNGGDGDDVIQTGNGNDIVNGNGGNDSINTGVGDDTVNGDAGTDTIDSGPGKDTLTGGADNDRLTGGPGADKVTGNAGDDILGGGLGALPTSLFPTTNTATIAALLDSGDVVVGNDGSDDVIGGDGSDLVVGGAYDTSAVTFTGTQTTTVYGVSATNVLTRLVVTTATVNLPTLAAVRTECASAGDVTDTGRDDVTGGPDADYVLGGGGADTLAGGAGNDVVCGRGGDDTLDGDGAEVTAVNQGADEMRGGPGNDQMYGSGGIDDMYGDAGSDLARGGNAVDTINGGAGSDLLLGEAGNDVITGDDTSTAASVSGGGRSITCGTTVSVVGGRIDLNGDLSGNSLDDGRLEGLAVTGGLVIGVDGAVYNGVLGGVVFVNGTADLDGNGAVNPYVNDANRGDTGAIDLAGVIGAIGDGDCILGGAGADTLDGVRGGDYVDGGDDDDPALTGGTGADLVRGGAGDDTAHGNDGDDLVAGDGGADLLWGDGGDDVVRGSSGDDLLAGGNATAAADGRDQVLGDGGNDVVAGGNAVLARSPIANSAISGRGVTLLTTATTSTALESGSDVPAGVDDQAYGGYGTDWVFAGSGDDQAFGGPDDDVVEGGPGNDAVQGDDGADLMVGGSSTSGAVTTSRDGSGTSDGNDTMLGDHGVDSLDGNDTMAGDNARLDPGSDVVLFDGSGADTMSGDGGVDLMYGQDGADTINGNAGNDLLVGGSMANGVTDGGDTISGNAGADIVAGDNAHLLRPASVTLRDVSSGAAPTAGAGDTINGNAGDDLLFGQAGDDTIAGDDDNDAIKGGGGADTINGNAGNDEIAGGAGTAASYDGGDTIHGDAGNDTVAGDNAVIDSTATPVVTLLDVPAAGATADANVSGGDTINGNAGDDTLFGGGGDDTVNGNDNKDAIEGDAGADTLNGNDGDDEITGGSSSTTGGITATRDATGQLDGADTIDGGNGDDVLAGDNARLVRTASARTDGTALRTVQLFDNVSSGTPPGGGETMTGADGRDLMFGQGGDDGMSGGDGVDYIEGNAGDDTIAGDGSEDDILGGSSAANGTVISGTGAGDRLLTPIPAATLVDSSAAGVLDGNDVLYGGSKPATSVGVQADGADVVLGDNGRVTKSCTLGTCASISGGGSGAHLVRQVAMADTAPGASSGSDVLSGQAGDDELYGQFDNTGSGTGVTYQNEPVPGDLLDGGAGDDALVGDQGVDVPTAASALGQVNRTISAGGSFVSELIRPSGTLVRVVTQTQAAVGGDDVLLGGTGFDSVHAGAGNDLTNAGDGDDVVFAGDGNDNLWGGRDHDRLFGGTGDDEIDAKKQDNDPLLWTLVAPVEDTDNLKATVNGFDTAYGGMGHDALQADVGDSGKKAGDRLMDWTGVYNIYLVCAGAYGAGKVLNKADPATVQLLTDLAAATGSVGGAELALVGNGGETNPKYPGAPGHFTCETG